MKKTVTFSQVLGVAALCVCINAIVAYQFSASLPSDADTGSTRLIENDLAILKDQIMQLESDTGFSELETTESKNEHIEDLYRKVDQLFDMLAAIQIEAVPTFSENDFPETQSLSSHGFTGDYQQSLQETYENEIIREGVIIDSDVEGVIQSVVDLGGSLVSDACSVSMCRLEFTYDVLDSPAQLTEQIMFALEWRGQVSTKILDTEDSSKKLLVLFLTRQGATFESIAEVSDASS